MNLTLTVVHETKKTNKLCYTGDDPDKLLIAMFENFSHDLIRQSNCTFKWFPF